MSFFRQLGAVALLPFLAACADGSSTSPVDLIEPEDGTSRVDTLVLLVSVQLEDPTSPQDGDYFDHKHITSLELEVNGETWGAFANVSTEPRAPGWTLSSSTSPALFVADLGEQAGVDGDKLKTVSDWVVLLRRYLAPGDYVASVRALTLTNDNGDRSTLHPRRLVPFEVQVGAQSAFVGPIDLVVNTL